MEERRVIENSGFHDFPYFVPRWYTSAGDIYGTSQAMTVLPTIKMLNAMDKTALTAAQLGVRPPLQAPDQGFAVKPNITPGALNYTDTQYGEIKPIVTGVNPAAGFDVANQKREAILRAFFVDQLNEEKAAEMTATEFLGRSEERMRNMSPQLGRMHVEYLQPLIERVFGLLNRKGLLPEPPPELVGKQLKVVYVSPLARAQKVSQVANVERILGAVSPFAALKPDVMDKFDADGYVDWIFALLDAPEQVTASEDQVNASREERKTAEQAAQQVELAKTGSEAIRNVAPFIQGGDSA